MFTQFHQTATGYFKKQTVFTATSESMAEHTYSAPSNTKLPSKLQVITTRTPNRHRWVG